MVSLFCDGRDFDAGDESFVLIEVGAIRRDVGQLILATAILDDTLAWVLYIHDAAVDSSLLHGPGPQGRVSPTGPTGLGNPALRASAPCVFMDAVNAINANAGDGLLDGGGGPEPEDPIRI